MNKLKELLANKAGLVAQAKAVQESAKILERDLTDEEAAKMQSILDGASKMDVEIKSLQSRADTLADLDRHMNALDTVDTPKTVASNSIEPVKVSVKEKWLEDPKRGFKSSQAFLMSVYRAARGGRVAGNLESLRVPVDATAGSDEQSTFSDPHGGFLVPTGFSPDLKMIAAEEDPTAALTMKVPMAFPTVEIPARVDKDHSVSVSGGLRVYRRAEADEVLASRMSFEKIQLQANSLFGIAFATEELLRDSAISLMAILDRGFRDEFTSRLLMEKIEGTGVGEYLGVLNSPAKISVAKEAGQAADTIVGLNLIKMRKRCWRYSQAVWLANHDTYDQLASAHIPGTNNDVFLFRPGSGTDVPETLLGRPIFFSEYAKTVGDQGDLILANWGEYMEGLYQPMETAESIHVRFVNHERAFKFFSRNDGKPWWSSVLTPKNSASTLSPIVVLDVRA